MPDVARLLHGAMIVLLVASVVGADSPAPQSSYKQVSPDGRFVFVMISPWPVETAVKRWVETKAQEIREIRKKYKRSGLYRNDGSTEPLWSVDWYALGVDVASDGVHLIRHGPWARSMDDEAISFFANGELLHTYTIRDLVDNSMFLDRTVSHFSWQQEGRFDDGRLEYSLTTKDRNRFVFDVRTGEVKHSFRPIRAIRWIIVGLCGIGLLGSVAWGIKRYADKRSP